MASEPAADDASAAPKKSGGSSPLVPALLALLVAPALTFAVAKFVLIPSLRQELSAPAAPRAAPAAPAESSGHGGGPGKSGESLAAGNSYKFENVVVNLAGTMGTRYLKTSFLVTGADAGLAATFETNKPALVDVTLNVLSSLTLGDLEEAGSKNLIREKLVQSYNQALGRKVAEQVFFSDFVVQ